MSFITQGKTNWKFILIVIVLAAIIGGVTWFLSTLTAKESLIPKEPVMSEEETTEEVEDEIAGPKKCIADDNCIIFGKTGDCNCGCFNKDYKEWQPGGECFCLSPASCKCVNSKCEEVFKETLLKIKDLDIKWDGEIGCGEVIEWAKVIDIDNDGSNELIISCYSLDKIFIFKWEDANFILQGELDREIEINPWNPYTVRSNDFGSIYHPGKTEFNMIYSPSGGVPEEEGNEETIWVRINTFEWNEDDEDLQSRLTKSLQAGSSWYIADVNNDSKDEIIFFSKTNPENWEDYSIRIFSWKEDNFVLLGKTNIENWRAFYPSIQPVPEPERFIFVADTNNNGLNEIVLLDEVGIRDVRYVYLGLEWDGKNFTKFKIDEKIQKKNPQYTFTQFRIVSVDDYDGNGENELITQALLKESEEFHLVIFRWNKEKNIYEQILEKTLLEYNFLTMGDINNDGVKELIFHNKENNLISLSCEED